VQSQSSIPLAISADLLPPLRWALHERSNSVRSGLIAVALIEILACYLIVRFVRRTSDVDSHLTAAKSSTIG